MALLLLSVAAGCVTEESIRKSREAGARAGFNDGELAGKAEGYKATIDDAEDAAYKDTIARLYASGEYNRIQTYSLLVLVFAFLSGFGLQYSALYLLRRNGFLYDIDRIVLHKQATQIDLSNLSQAEEPAVLAARNSLALPSPDEPRGRLHG